MRMQPKRTGHKLTATTQQPPGPALPQDALASRLAQLPPLGDAPPSAQPAHLPAPDGGARRAAAARQAHALALAGARVGSKWWLPLRRLAGEQAAAAAGCADGEEAAEWAEQDAARARAWERLRREAAAAPSGLLGRRAAAPGGGGGGGVQIEYSLESCGA